MATTINSYSVSLGLDASGYVSGANLSRSETRNLIKDIESARTPAEKFGLEQDRLKAALDKGAISQGVYNRLLQSKREQLGQVSPQVSRYAGALGLVGVAAAATVASGAAFVAHLRNVQNELDATIKSATKLGLSFNELSSIRFAASEIGGLDASQTDAAIKKMQINIAKAAGGDEAIQKVFQRIGIDAGEAIEAGPVEALKRISDAFREIESPAERLKIAVEIFGKSGADMVDTLMAGRDVIDESTRFQERWNSLTDAQAVGVESNNDAWGRVFFVIEGLTNKLAAEFAPAMQLIADYLLDSVDGATGVDEGIRSVVDTTVYLLGVSKDVFEVLTLWHKTLHRISTLDFSSITNDVTEALDFTSGDKALQALYNKRFELEQQAAEKQKKRDEERQKLVLEDLDEQEKKAKEADDERKRQLEEADRKLTTLAGTAIKNAEAFFAQQRASLGKQREATAKGPGAGIDVGSAEAAKFLADQINAQIGAAAVPEIPTPGEKELIAEAKRQSEMLVQQERRNAEMLETMKRSLEELKNNGFARIR